MLAVRAFVDEREEELGPAAVDDHLLLLLLLPLVRRGIVFDFPPRLLGSAFMMVIIAILLQCSVVLSRPIALVRRAA